MRFLRTAILAVGLMGLVGACGSKSPEAEEPAAAANPCANPCAENPCAENPCADNPCADADDMGGEDDMWR
ncbi:hypothetical protein [Haliangium sp.]|uniref:hypothetical protein n=1 Tax=Haliangium sp. TaxID=2663208 RepID=UPI003D0ED443